MDLLSGLFFTTERPSIVGGLGRVSVDIPMALNKHASIDCRVIQPITGPVVNLDLALPPEERFSPTGLSIKLRTQGGSMQRFDLNQRFDNDSQTWIYGVSNELFARFDHLYFALNARFSERPLKDAFGLDAIFSANMLFTRAASIFARFLDPSARLPGGVNLKRFDLPIDFVVLNDWLTGQGAQEVLSCDCSELGVEAPPPLAGVVSIFMIHNIYDEKRSIKRAEQNNISVPSYIFEEATAATQNGKHLQKTLQYSPFRTGARLSDWLIVDGNYLDTLLEQSTKLPVATKRELKSKRVEGRYTTVVHAPSQIFNPVENSFLSCDGFQALPSNFFLEAKNSAVRMKILQDYKRFNRCALQRKLGNRDRELGYLQEDEKAIIYSYAGRFDPYQKGFFLMASALKDFLLANPQVQVVIAGGGGAQPAEEKLVNNFLLDLIGDRRLKGRFVRAGELEPSGRIRSLDTKGLVQLLAGSSALLCPSLYEPYGLSQLEAMWLGTSPVGHAVDGLLSTIRDFDEACEAEQPNRPHPRYGPTGFLMPKVANPSQYELALRAWLGEQSRDIKSIRPTAQQRLLLEKANQAFMALLERSLFVLSDESSHMHVVNNALSYIQEEHNWATISLKYRSAIESAKQRSEKNQAVVVAPASFAAASF